MCLTQASPASFRSWSEAQTSMDQVAPDLSFSRSRWLSSAGASGQEPGLCHPRGLSPPTALSLPLPQPIICPPRCKNMFQGTDSGGHYFKDPLGKFFYWPQFKKPESSYKRGFLKQGPPVQILPSLGIEPGREGQAPGPLSCSLREELGGASEELKNPICS